MMAIDSGILLKNDVNCNFILKYYITMLPWQFTKTLNQLLDVFRENKNLKICMLFLFEQLNESK